MTTELSKAIKAAEKANARVAALRAKAEAEPVAAKLKALVGRCYKRADSAGEYFYRVVGVDGRNARVIRVILWDDGNAHLGTFDAFRDGVVTPNLTPIPRAEFDREFRRALAIIKRGGGK